MNSGGTDSGAFIVEANAEIHFGGTTTFTSTSTITGAGAAGFDFGGTAVVGGAVNVGEAVLATGNTTFNGSFSAASAQMEGGSATFTKSASIGSLVVSGGSFFPPDNSGTTLNVTSNMTWTGGTIYHGNIKISSNTTPDAAMLTIGIPGTTTTNLLIGATLENDGTAVLHGGSLSCSFAIVNNNGTLTVGTDGNYTFSDPGNGGNQFNNAGTLIQNGSGVTTLGDMQFTNTGIVNVQQGTLDIGQ